MPVWGEQLDRSYAAYSNADTMVGARLDTLITFLESLQVRDRGQIGD